MNDTEKAPGEEQQPEGEQGAPISPGQLSLLPDEPGQAGEPTTRPIEPAPRPISDLYPEWAQTLSNAQHALKKFAAGPVFKDRLARMRENWIEQGRQMEREAAAQEGEAEPLQLLKSIYPENAVFPNSKVINKLTLLCNRAGKNTLLKANKDRAKEPIAVIASLAYDDKNLHTSKALTGYDREVLNGVCSLFEAGNKHFTPAMVYRAMNGITHASNISAEATKKISQSIDKLRFTRLTIDYTAQAIQYGLNAKTCKVDDMLLSIQGVRIQNQNGEEIGAYQFNTIPILYSYSKRIGQVITVPMEMLDTRKLIKTTNELTVIKGYLIRRIETMKRKGSKLSNKIQYETITGYAGLGMGINQTRKAGKVREQVTAILDHLTEKGMIRGHAPYKIGRAFIGVEITY